jgi:2-polyprenyl-6-methoxyphenol hydroxylase-like FAD-dependent oxidoreductase
MMNTLQNDVLEDNSKCESKAFKSDEIVDVLIAGGGIGGFVTALCLHRAGYSVRVHERVEEIEPNGFGVTLQPYCVKLLFELGLEKEMEKIGVRPRMAEFYSRHGQLIYKDPRGMDAQFNWPLYTVHRGRFQELLLSHIRDEVGEKAIRLSQKLVSFRQQPSHVEVDFINPATGDLNIERGKVLVGADGINSAVRRILYPDEGPTLWDGVALWRGVTPVDKLYLDGRTIIFMGNPNDRELIIFPVDEHILNWALAVRIEQPGIRPIPVISDWDKLGKIEDVLPLLSEMKLDFLDTHHLISSSTIVNEFLMTDRDPLPRWSHDRVTLLGDAAHPMYPNGGNGASQAIIDARGLVLAFREYGVTSQALQKYDDLRRTFSSNFVQMARQAGPEKILRFIDERSPSRFRDLSDVASPSELEAIMVDYKRAVGWNAQQLNHEPPLF